MRILLFDNYDSFTYNLVHLLEGVDPSVSVDVLLNDAEDFSCWQEYDKIVLSPGPGLPEESGNLMRFIAEVEGKRPLLGVCLGLQALVVHYGGALKNLENVLHGVAIPTTILDSKDPAFTGLLTTFPTGRYHSWVADPEKLPSALRCVATDPDGQVMAIRHRNHDTFAVQFHPESILTPNGAQILANWIKT